MDAELRRAAEAQARRSAPDRPAKRRRVSDGAPEEAEHEELARYEYSGVDALLQDGRAFVVLCSFRRWVNAISLLASIGSCFHFTSAAHASACCREKSATREAVRVLSAYLQPAGPVATGHCREESACSVNAVPEPARLPAPGSWRSENAGAPGAEPGSAAAAWLPEAASLAVVRMACCGLVCLRLLGPGDPMEVVEQLVRDVESGKRPQLQCALQLHSMHICDAWCHCLPLYSVSTGVQSKQARSERSHRPCALHVYFALLGMSPAVARLKTLRFYWEECVSAMQVRVTHSAGGGRMPAGPDGPACRSRDPGAAAAPPLAGGSRCRGGSRVRAAAVRNRVQEPLIGSQAAHGCCRAWESSAGGAQHHKLLRKGGNGRGSSSRGAWCCGRCGRRCGEAVSKGSALFRRYHISRRQR